MTLSSLSADISSAGLAFTSGYMFSYLPSPLIITTTTRTTTTTALSANPTSPSPHWFLSMEEACLLPL
jgi:hypothetical protein